MRKTLLFAIIIVIVSLAFISCSDEMLERTGLAMKSFAGMDENFSDEEISQQTSVITSKANGISMISSNTDLRTSSTNAKNVIKDLIDSIIDNPAGNLNEKTNVDIDMLNQLVETNNPISHYTSGSDVGDIRQAITENKEMLNSLGPEMTKTINNILDVFSSGTDFLVSSSEKATAKEVAEAATVAMMGSSINQLIDTLVNDQPEDKDDLISTCLDLISEFDDAANSYMQLTGKTSLTLTSAINIKDFNSLADNLQEGGKN